MSSVKLCALLVLAIAAVVTASPHKGQIPEELRAAIKDCGVKHSVGDTKDALFHPDIKYGCFYDCLHEETKDKIKSSDSPMAKILASCEETTPTTGEKCADALELKKCMKDKWMEAHPDFKGE